MKNLIKNKAVKILIGLLIVFAVIVIAAVLFLKLNPAFGGRASKEDKADYAERADNYADEWFSYPEEWELDGVSEDKPISQKDTKPQEELPIKSPDFDDKPDIEEVNVTWFGHSNLLVQMHGMNILIDPVFSERTSPVSFIGPKRFSELPLEIDELPHIDIAVISHDHYDHLDMDSVKALDEKTDRFIVPLGVENHLERWGISADKVTNMAWWEETQINGLTVACTPARHASGRGLDRLAPTLYASWVFEDEYHRIFESGDTGYGGHFGEIHKRYGDFDLVMMDCAQFNMKWHYIHMFPEESAEAAQTLGAKTAMPIHWGAFVLSSHAWDDPPERFTSAAESNGMTVVTPQIGETMRLEKPEDYQDRWWKDIK